MTDVELDLRLPEPFASIPRTPLLFGPSPIQHLPRISAALGGRVQVYAKREDCNSGLAFGGNKVRKLEYLAADALAQGSDTLVSIGGVQSNHTRAVAAVAAALGLQCALVQEHWVDLPAADGGDAPADAAAERHYETVGNIQLSRLMGAAPRLEPQTSFGIEHKPTLAQLERELAAAGREPYYIPAGASDHPLGGLGFARWALEVEAQERDLQRRRGVDDFFFDTIVICAVTGSTLAGAVAGFRLAQERLGSRARRVIGIDASAAPEATRAQVLRIARATAARIGLAPADVRDADVELDERYHGGRYGVADARTLDAIRFGARTEAFITDPVYEGKSLAGLMDLVRNREIPDGSNVLYAHLGGQLALNAYPDIQ
ncbi:putative 1-aminocyclopropane-1-carboxylate deaminase [Durotheca rogersii]|uniref:putative 1-aminocyclopropane-1-carboxylate deaminase n=1 Tax=Durotheca rogersii TaxID=419775 RepID=UPI002220135D|nr:putative 1-aminocyclopropane-1-carboxylate deaminase [Durotheca rogersii]KAI5859560.1 putative 1-aminocyclopropane-1-carboxylate deaminase [Durotheca rogersii]